LITLSRDSRGIKRASGDFRGPKKEGYPAISAALKKEASAYFRSLKKGTCITPGNGAYITGHIIPGEGEKYLKILISGAVMV